MSKRSVLMVGTSPGGRGGVAAVVSVYQNSGLFERWPVRYIVSHRDGGALTKLWAGLCAGLIVARELALGRVAVLHVHSSQKGSFYRKSIYLALARLAGVPTVFHLHSGAFDRFVQGRRSPVASWWIRRTLQRSDRLVALSDSWASYLRQLAPTTPVVVLPNPVVVPPSIDRDRESPGRLLFLGRASEQKGVFDLLRALVLVRAQVPHVRLVVAGDGDLQALAAAARDLGVSDLLEIKGWLGGEAKELEYQTSQVFVLPSYGEGLPMAMLECMARAKAVVVTPVGGIPEAVDDGRSGLMVPAGDVAALASALTGVLVDEAQRLVLGAGARDRILQRYSAATILEQLTRLYANWGVAPLQERPDEVVR